MKNFIISLLIFILWAFLGMWWYYSCSICNIQHQTTYETQKKEHIVNDITEKKAVETNNKFLTINNDSGSEIFKFPDHLTIYRGADSVHIPMTSMSYKDSIFNYLNNNQNKQLQLVGWYKKGEWKNNNDKLNLGFDRANYIKNMLVEFGINADKINVKGVQHDYDYTAGTYNGGIELYFKEISKTKALEIDNGVTNITLYTKFNSREFIPDNTLLTYTYDLKNYLQKHANKTVKITGHTDNVGELEDNEIIGRDRATNVMNHFISQGIATTKLQVFSKGELAPIADNNTKEGRAKNRRIEIIVN